MKLVLEEEWKSLMQKNKRIAKISTPKMPKKMQNSFMKTAKIHLIFNNDFTIRKFGHDFLEKSLGFAVLEELGNKQTDRQTHSLTDNFIE